MMIAYLDESYTQESFCLGAFVVDVKLLAVVDAAVAETMNYASGFGVSRSSELHAHELMCGKGDWQPLRGRHRESLTVYRTALAKVGAMPASVFFCGVDVRRLNARFRYPAPPHLLLMMSLLERLNAHALRRSDTMIVVADHIPDALARQAAVLGRGAWVTDSTDGPLEALLDPVLFASSEHNAGLQVADLLVYLYRRRTCHRETNAKTQRAVDSLWECVEPLIVSERFWEP